MTVSPDSGNLEETPAQNPWIGMAITGAKGVGKSDLLDLLVQGSRVPSSPLSEDRTSQCLAGVEGRQFCSGEREFVAWGLDDPNAPARDLVELFSITDLVVHVTDGSKVDDAEDADELRSLYFACQLGVSRFVLVINSLDGTGGDPTALDEAIENFLTFAEEQGMSVKVDQVLVSVSSGRNVIDPAEIDGTDGLSLLDQLDRMEFDKDLQAGHNELPVSDQFDSTIVWLSDEALLAGRWYDVKFGSYTGKATVTKIKHRLNVTADEERAATKLDQDQIGRCNISIDQQVPFRPYAESRALGRFRVIDAASDETLGFAMINFSLRRADNLTKQSLSVGRLERSELKQHKPAVIWFTGLSGAGKSTIADALEQRLHNRGCHTILLDGDNVRHGLNRDLGFTDADRVENVRRVGEVAGLMADAGLMVIVSLISPFIAERQMVRSILPEGEFLEVFVDTPLSVAEERDVKGLYKKARAGMIKNFTGIDSPYEVPDNPEIVLNTTANSADESASSVERYLKDNGFLTD